MLDGTQLVFGANGGIGRAICAQTPPDRLVSIDLAESFTDASKSAERSIRCDIADHNDVERAIDAAAAFGAIGSVVIAVGVVDEAPLHELTVEQWKRILAISLDGTFYVMRSVLPHLMKRHASSIVAFSTGWVAQGYPLGAHYAAAKSGVEALVRSAAKGYAAEGVRVNAVSPGPIDTPMLRNLPDPDQRIAAASQRIPLGRIGKASEVADVVAWLTSDRSSYVTGQVIQVSGGLVV